MAAKKAAKPRTGAAATLTVTQLKSTIGFDKKQATVIKGLGLRKLNHTVTVPDTIAVRGMLHKVRHLVKVEGR
jgi:large subunit ribosomal protein L30